ncbi:hypothetical protein HYX15_01700 [Candidatus Woesearchaeota archaeon]|nr:hypothetical protein [Candidatus Woesearchaeota archaeon]
MINDDSPIEKRRRNIEERIWSLSGMGLKTGIAIITAPIAYGLIKSNMGLEISQTENEYIFNIIAIGGIVGYTSALAMMAGHGINNFIYRRASRRQTN